MPFYVGLSLLSESALDGKSGTHFLLHNEGRHILHLLDSTTSSAIKNESSGRPFFDDGHADFSISHSGRIAAVAFTNRISPTGRALNVGCDIQLVKTGKMRRYITQKFYAPEERKYIENAGGGLCLDTNVNDHIANLRFHQIWVLKEAFLKAHGLSVIEIKKAPAFMFSQNNDFGKAQGTSNEITGTSRKCGAMKITVCTNPINKITGMRYFLYESREENSERYVMAAAIEESENSEPPELRWYTQPCLYFTKTAET
jgi:phosphopantetheinyl transferase (holo-ACP synthase)